MTVHTRKNFSAAVREYEAAMELASVNPSDPQQQASCTSAQLLLHSNLAACYLKARISPSQLCFFWPL
jgi:hypothetical protein